MLLLYSMSYYQKIITPGLRFLLAFRTSWGIRGADYSVAATTDPIRNASVASARPSLSL